MIAVVGCMSSISNLESVVIEDVVGTYAYMHPGDCSLSSALFELHPKHSH